MITVYEVVTQVLHEDDIALEAARLGILNLSSYAKIIKAAVEEKTMKEVRLGTIVVALSRCIPRLLEQVPPRIPSLIVQDISIRTPLFELSFEKTADILQKVSTLSHVWLNQGFFTLTEGLGEVTIISDEALRSDIRSHFNTHPKGEYTDLVGITVRFDEQEYLEIPNAIFSLMNALSTKRVNVIEVVSTYTEISFIIRSKEMDLAIAALKPFFSKSV
jgi:hypothetical protein